MPLPFDPSTLLLIFAPFLVPKLFQFASGVLARRRSKPGYQAYEQPPRQQTRSKQRTLASNALLLLIVAYSLVRITYKRPFNIFSSLGQIPLTAPNNKLSSTLAWHNLSEKHGHVLSYLTSVDTRLLYAHFGQDTFIGCHQLLGSAQAKDLLAYHAVRLFRVYALLTLGLALANPRWRVWLGLAAGAGCLGELYLLASTEIALQANGRPVAPLGSLLPFWRHLGFLALSALAWFLPSAHPVPQLEREETAFLGTFQQLIRQQDMLQTRIRALEAFGHIDKPERTGNVETRQISEEQAKQLRAWLQAILEAGADGFEAKPTSADMATALRRKLVEVPAKVGENHIKGEEADVKRVKIEEQEIPVKLEAAEDELPSPRAARLPPAIILPSQADNPLSPLLSSSSSASSGLDTPTPSTNVPESFDLFATSVKLAAVKEKKKEEEAEEERAKPSQDIRQPSPTSIVNTDGQSSEPRNGLPEQDIQDTLVSQDEKAVDSEQRVSIAEQLVSGLAYRAGADQETHLPPGAPQLQTADLPREHGSGTPYQEAREYQGENGWTTVVSKKQKSR